MKCAVSILLLLLPFVCPAEKKQGKELVDSFLQELPRAREDTNKVLLLDAIVVRIWAYNPDDGIKYGQQGLALAQKLDYKKGEATAYMGLGVNYRYKSDYQKTIACYKQAIQIDEEIGFDTGEAATYTNLCIVYIDLSDYVRALDYGFKALKMNEGLKNKRGIASNLSNIGIIYDNQGDLAQALAYHNRALKMHLDLNDKERVAICYCNIGLIYQEEKKYDSALTYYFEALKLSEEVGNESVLANTTGYIGSVYLLRKNYTMAVEFFRKALKTSEELGDKHLAADCLRNIGNAYIAVVNDTAAKTRANGRQDKVTGVAELSENKYEPTPSIPAGNTTLIAGAIDYLLRSLAIGKEINALDVVRECYEGLCEAYKLKGDYKKAMEYGDNARAIKDSVFSQQSRNQIAKLEGERKEYGDSLKAVSAKKVADISAQHRRNYEYIGLGALALSIGFIFLLTRNNKLLGNEKKQSESLLLNILPEEVAAQLKKTGGAATKHFDDVTVLFTDFVNFTEAGQRMSPHALIEELHTCFKKFDEITSKYGVEKIKTIGDAYLAVAGLPTTDPNHAEHMVRTAVEINAFMLDRIAKLGNRTFEIRIGIHSGSVVAGIVGVKKFAYDIWGDTVNTAARMEQSSEAGRINISQTTYELVKDKFDCEYRGEIEAKGKGDMKMYFINGFGKLI